jgi:hypothetical protein
MEKEFVSYEIALALKELGFDEPCLMVYNYKKQVILNNKIPYKERTNQPNPYLCTAPLKQQVFRWFREKYELIYFIGDDFGGWSYSVSKNSKIQGSISNVYKTYEETELGCINKLIEIVKNK